ncbi:MAG: hypothetical protein JNJ54_07300 [Myxococcaceae bacterium]|nr:hypothetical protein [Myxococcaceae bacterium]
MTLAAGIVTLLLAAGDRNLVIEAIQASSDVSHRVEVVESHLGLPSGCVPRRVLVDDAARASGVLGLGVEGTSTRGRCEGRGWARVRVFAPAWVTTRALKGGERLEGAISQVERERGSAAAPLTELDPGALAATSLAKGLVLEARHVRGSGPGPGDRVSVIVEHGEIQLEQDGVLVACAKTCARLGNGHRVEGELVNGKLKVTP